MSGHCSYRRWRCHPGGHRTYQCYTSSRYIARISLRHVADGGCDAA